MTPLAAGGWRQRGLDWLGARSRRERWLLAVALVLMAGWLVHAALWQPVQTRREAALARIALHDRAILALRSDPPAPAPAAAAAADPRPLNAIATQTAAAFDLAIRRLEPQGAGLRVTLDEAAFQSLVLWLEALARDHRLTATELDLDRRPAPGAVSAVILLERLP